MSHSPKFKAPKTGYYIQCDVCGYKIHIKQAMMRWDKKLVCKEDWEERHPQDTIQIPRREKWPKLIRPETTDIVFTDIYSDGHITADDL